MKKNNGFTLVEIIVVTLMIAIIVAIASPEISRSIRNYNFSNDMRLMVAAINMARSRALQTGLNTTVQFIPGNDAEYIAFFDNGEGAAFGNGIFDNGETIIKRGNLHDGIVMKTPDLQTKTLNNGKSMTFNGIGLPWGFNAGAPVIYSGTIEANMQVDASTTRTRQITISSGGRLSVK